MLEERRVGCETTGTSATEMQVSPDLEKVQLWNGAWYKNHLALSLQCTLTLHIFKRVGPGPEAWVRNHYAVSFDHTLTLREVLMSLKTSWPIRTSSLTCQSEVEEGASGRHVAG